MILTKGFYFVLLTLVAVASPIASLSMKSCIDEQQRSRGLPIPAPFEDIDSTSYSGT